MAHLLKRLRRGVSMSPLLLIGLLIALSIFRKKKNISPMEYDLLIQKIITGNGYSDRVGRFFAAVSRHETGNYTSNVLRSANNLFGMKFPNVRKTTARNEDSSGYAVYNSAADSVLDLVLYLDARDYYFDYATSADLVKTMKVKNYFEASLEEYIHGVERALPKVSAL